MRVVVVLIVLQNTQETYRHAQMAGVCWRNNENSDVIVAS